MWAWSSYLAATNQRYDFDAIACLQRDGGATVMGNEPLVDLDRAGDVASAKALDELGDRARGRKNLVFSIDDDLHH